MDAYLSFCQKHGGELLLYGTGMRVFDHEGIGGTACAIKIA